MSACQHQHQHQDQHVNDMCPLDSSSGRWVGIGAADLQDAATGVADEPGRREAQAVT